MGLTPPLCKNYFVNETVPEENRTDLIDDEQMPGNRNRIWKTKKSWNFGTWNVRTLNNDGAIEEMENQVSKYKLKILALQEMRITGTGTRDLKKGRIYYSGTTNGKHEEGVGLYVDRKLVPSVVDFKPISSRLAYMRIHTQWIKTSLVVVHAPTDVSEDTEKDDWYNQIESLLDTVPRHDALIVLGDWNAKVGRETAAFGDVIGEHSLHLSSTDNGIRMISLATQYGLVVGSTLFPHKDIHKGTWLSPDGRTINQIDHVLIRRKFRTSLCDVRSMKGADCGSDHFLVRGKLKIKLRKTKNEVKRRGKFDVSKLKEDETKHEYQVEINNRFEALEEEGLDIKWDEVKKVIIEAAEAKIGYERKRKNMWYDEECGIVANERRRNRIAWLEERNDEEKRERYRRSRRKARRTYRRKKRELVDRQMREIELNRRNRKVRDQYLGIKSARKGFQPRSNLINSADGRVLANEEEIMSRWREYFETLLNRPGPETPVEEEERREPEIDELNDEEILRSIKKLKSNRAAGSDEIVAELMKCGGETLERYLIAIFKSIWQEEEIPTEWQEGIYVPIHKKGERSECVNYRGICLLTIGYKVLTRILCERIMPWYLDAVGDYQAGFVPGKSTVDNIFIIRQINEKYREYARTSWHVFVDYQQAYDSVHRASLWNILRYFDIPEKIVRLIQACYHNQRGRVRVGGAVTEPFNISTGLRQGCPLSCILFNLTLEWIMRHTPPAPDPVRLSHTSCDRLAFADDCDLMGETYQGRDEQLDNFDRTGRRAGLEIKESKTKVMKASRDNRTEDFIELGSLLLEEVDQFKYLGSMVSASSSMTEEIMARIAAASKCSWALNDLIRSKLLTKCTKLQIYVTCIRPVATYGCETWPLTQELERRMLVFEHSILRRIYGAVRDEVTGDWRRRHNAELRELSHLPLITSYIRAQRLRWAGHVARMDPNTLVRQVFDGVPEGRRPVGRPRLRWRDCVQQDLRLLGVQHPERWMEMAQSRGDWRTLVAAAKDHDGLQLLE